MKKDRTMCAGMLLLCLLFFLPARAEAQEVRTPDTAIHILLIGQDQRPGEPGKRSDCLILCSFHPENRKLYLTSFLRDLYVKIPGYGYERINASYALGGAELLEKTLEENFGVRVDGWVEVDFDHFPGIIEKLGGVELELRPDEAREIRRLVPGSTVSEGMQKLNGSETLVYARIRRLDADSDFSRTQRQRKVLTSLADRYRDLSFPELIKLAGAILPAVTTDLNTFEILTYGQLLLPMLRDMEILDIRVPDAGACRDETVRGMQVLMPDLPKIRRQLAPILGEKPE